MLNESNLRRSSIHLARKFTSREWRVWQEEYYPRYHSAHRGSGMWKRSSEIKCCHLAVCGRERKDYTSVTNKLWNLSDLTQWKICFSPTQSLMHVVLVSYICNHTSCIWSSTIWNMWLPKLLHQRKWEMTEAHTHMDSWLHQPGSVTPCGHFLLTVHWPDKPCRQLDQEMKTDIDQAIPLISRWAFGEHSLLYICSLDFRNANIEKLWVSHLH